MSPKSAKVAISVPINLNGSVGKKVSKTNEKSHRKYKITQRSKIVFLLAFRTPKHEKQHKKNKLLGQTKTNIPLRIIKITQKYFENMSKKCMD